MTLLTLIQDACDELGLPRPSVVMTSTDPTIRQLVALSEREGAILARRYPWQNLLREANLTTVASQPAYDLPDDYGFHVNDSLYDRSQGRAVEGPVTSQHWQAIQASAMGTAAALPIAQFRLRGNQIYLTPTPSSVRTLVMEYVTSQWCEASDGTGQTSWNADSDVPRVDRQLLLLGTKWRFLKAKGFEYGDDLREYELEVRQASARDGGRSVIRLNSKAVFADEMSGSVSGVMNITWDMAGPNWEEIS